MTGLVDRTVMCNDFIYVVSSMSHRGGFSGNVCYHDCYDRDDTMNDDVPRAIVVAGDGTDTRAEHLGIAVIFSFH